MKILRVFLAVLLFWLLLMVFSGPLERVFGQEWVNGAIDMLFVLIEVFLLSVFGISLFLARKYQRRRVPRILIPGAAVNGRPIRFVADTGASVTALMSPAAKRLGLATRRIHHVRANSASGGMSLTEEPVELGLGAQTFSGRLPILHVAPVVRLILLVSRTQAVDGLFGWPGLRENLLFFDAVQKHLRLAAETPAEGEGWVKLKLRPAGVLLLEIPRADGKTGTLLVDTGAAHGISLPPQAWAEWRAAHPQALRSGFFGTTLMFMPGTAMGAHEERWAEEIAFGPLALTDMPLRQANTSEIRAGGGDDFLGSLGLYALARLDLVVDARNGFAYARPRPAPGPAYFSIKRPNALAPDPAANPDWTLDPQVTFQLGHLVAFNCICDGVAKRAAGDLEGALAAFDQALQLEPRNAQAYLNRGMLRRKQRDFAAAVEDFNRVIEFDPKNSSAYLIRAITLLNINNQDAAFADFDEAKKLHAAPARLRLFRLLGRLSQWIGGVRLRATEPPSCQAGRGRKAGGRRCR